MSPYYFVQQLQAIWRRLTTLESRVAYSKLRFTPSALVVSAEDYGTLTIAFPGARVGDAVIVSFPPTNGDITADAVVDANDSFVLTIYNRSTVGSATLTGTWSAFRLA